MLYNPGGWEKYGKSALQISKKIDKSPSQKYQYTRLE